MKRRACVHGKAESVTELEYEKNKERNVRWRQVSSIDVTLGVVDQGLDPTLKGRKGRKGKSRERVQGHFASRKRR